MNFALTCVKQGKISHQDSFLLEFPQNLCWAARRVAGCTLSCLLPAVLPCPRPYWCVSYHSMGAARSPVSSLEFSMWHHGLPGFHRWPEVFIFWALCAILGPNPCCGVPISPLEVWVQNEENMFFWKFFVAYQSKTPHGVSFRSC